ncbi:FCD domain-containing protein [Photobacterium nomapromontoriensis]|uniref:FCD domain-containing protein n=1 Tax=Photobacterium nomapromontoriensis TaxID=2910237 RepID=UPI003D0B52D5
MSVPTLSDQVMEMIRQDILSGQLPPKQKLVVAELKERYHVGASPIREALVQLSWRKYVIFTPQKGCWVMPVSASELDDLFKARLALTALLLPQAISHGDEAWEINILTHYHKLSRLMQGHINADVTEWIKRHHDFHLAILAGSQSPTLMALYQQVDEQIERYRHIWLNQLIPDTQCWPGDNEHEAIMKAVLARDNQLAMTLLTDHSQPTLAIIKQYLAS